MNGSDHRLVTEAALSILKDMEGPQEGPRLKLLDSLYILMDSAGGKDALVPEAYTGTTGTDYLQDLEFVHVKWGRDNPHISSVGEDEPHYSEEGHNFTAFNHFIDIKKGPGNFDDYDGYSYNKGSACQDQFQEAADATSGFSKFLATLTGFKVDEGLNYWYNDEYVHAPGQPWYQPEKCSQSIEHYSFPQDKGIYASVEAESLARFPLADSTGAEGKGIPYSVFMPLDNLARYWYEQYIDNKKPEALGRVLHAIQDASIPHHAAGYMGNWHQHYENDVSSHLLLNPQFIDEARALVEQWSQSDSPPPVSLSYPESLALIPSINWRVDQLVTWVAMNAYQVYDQIYQHYRPTREVVLVNPPVTYYVHYYWFDTDSARRLSLLATAMSVLVLKKTNPEKWAVMGISVTPSSIAYGATVQVIVHAYDNGPVDGIVWVNAEVAGKTNEPFTYTFEPGEREFDINQKKWVWVTPVPSGKVTSAGYRPTEIPFYFKKPRLMKVHVPVSAFIGQAVQVTVIAQDEQTHRPVAGTVMINGKTIGPTNTPFNYTFTASSTTIDIFATDYQDARAVVTAFKRVLEVSVSPDLIHFGTATKVTKQITVNATDYQTHIPVAGRVIIDGQDKGRTNERLTCTLHKEIVKTFDPRSKEWTTDISFPSGWVTAPGYEDAEIPFVFD
jgi:hypothetical protein